MQGRRTKGFWTRKKILIVVVLIAAAGLIIGLAVGLTRRGGSSGRVGGTPSTSPLPPGTTTKPLTLCRNTKDMKPPAFVPPQRGWMNMTCRQSNSSQCPANFTKKPLLLISLDGFRAEYLLRNFSPVLHKLSKCGVHAPYMRSIFPSKTFPNHYSIATGLYAESHGIIQNDMYDPVLKERFCIRCSTKFSSNWWGGEPIWVTAKKQGKRSAAMFFPGTEVEIKGVYPDICYIYNKRVPFKTRVEEVLRWMDLPPTETPDMMTLHFHEPDSAGHDHGPYAKQVNDKLLEVDGMIGMLMDGLVARNLHNCLNILIVADHGMEEVTCRQTVEMDRYVDISKYFIYDGAFGRMTGKYVSRNGSIVETPDGDSAEEILKQINCKSWYMEANKKQDLPKRYHYSNNRRIEDVILEPENHYTIQRTKPGPTETWSCEGGKHGYDPEYTSMHALFLAHGPSFKTGYKVEEFENIELYNLMTDLLQITPAPNNGTAGLLHEILKSPPKIPSKKPARGHYSSCLYPSYKEAMDRQNSTGCSCPDIKKYTNMSLEELNGRLNLREADWSDSMKRNLPLGIPEIDLQGGSTCVLTHQHYISGYSKTYDMPLWTAYHLKHQTSYKKPYVESRLTRQIADCIRPNVRLPRDHIIDCSYTDLDLNITQEFLFPPGFTDSVKYEEQFDALLATNLAPMYSAFKHGLWKDALLMVEEYASYYNNIQVITGPIFDYDSDGMADDKNNITLTVSDEKIPVPSDFFIILTKCGVTDRKGTCSKHDVMATILPHKQCIPNCRERDTFRFMEKNSARVRDIEILTGLRFFSDLEQSQRLRLITELQPTFWKRPSWMDEPGCHNQQAATCPTGWEVKPVLLISLDSFRPDYILRNFTPTIEKIRDCGTRATKMRSVYPSHTFPNHYTQATGLYPESHGIISNDFYDTEFQQFFSLYGKNKSDPMWWGGEPIWNTVTKHNKTAYTFFWPGSDVKIQGKLPTVTFPYSSRTHYHFRVDTVLGWLNQAEKADFISLYISNIDKAGHTYGPNSRQVNEALVLADGYINRLMDGLYRLNRHNCVNIILVSDHGMTDIDCSRQEYVRDHVNVPKMHVWQESLGRVSNKYWRDGPRGEFHLVPPQEQVDSNKILSKLECHLKESRPFDKALYPKRHHYANNIRIDQIVISVNNSWMIGNDTAFLCFLKGMHGYEETYDSMQALFLAHGPDFKLNHTIEEFENIELYNLLTDLLEIEPAPNNGTNGTLYPVLKVTKTLPNLLPSEEYQHCNYPSSTQEYNRRVAGSDCQCSLNSTLDQDERLNMTEPQKNEFVTNHTPYGQPYLYNNDTVCILHHRDFLSGYSHNRQMALWTAFTLTKDQIRNHRAPDCLRLDPRVEPEHQQNCSNYAAMMGKNISMVQLFPSEFSSSQLATSDATIITNIVPMLKTFARGVWTNLLTKLKSWVQSYNKIHVIAGPIFDYNYDGHWDSTDYIGREQEENNVLVPSHYYLIVLRCVSTCCNITMDYEIQTFIMPHVDRILNCRPIDEYIMDNRARLRDVELLTGLQFLTSLNTQEGLLTRTRLPPQMWGTD